MTTLAPAATELTDMIAPAGRRIVALIPAHNEEAALPAALASLHAQHHAITEIVVVADNCTDRTVELARELGARAFETVANRDKKAGDLNQALAQILPTLDDDDLILVMDADSGIVPEFVEIAVARLDADPRIGAVGGVFQGDPGAGLIGALQRNEYARYGREVARKQGKAKVLTGTASIFRVQVMREVAAARGELVPGRAGQVYDTLALTEDNEVTLAVKTLGYRAVSPKGCLVRTEVMPTLGDLWRQRLRWHRGALENLRNYGLNRTTAPYAFNQAMIYLGILFTLLFVAATVTMAMYGVLSVPQGVWLYVTGLFVAERVITVRARGRGGMLLAAPIVVEFAYELFQQAVFVRAGFDALTRRGAEWHHVSTAAPAAAGRGRHRAS